MAELPNAAQVAFWDELATGWLRGEQHSEKISGPFGSLAMDRLGLSPGQQVLDVGCGSGPNTVEIARRVEPDGEVIGVDISPTMVAAAQARATAAGVANARFVTADVQTDDLGAGPFDAVFSRFGVMFFTDPELAFDRLHRALRPGGRVVFTCWQHVFANEWMFVPGAAVVAVTGTPPPMPGPGEPGPFSLAEPGRAADLLEHAGFTDIVVDPVAEMIVLPESDVAALLELSQLVGPVREALRDADDATRHQILDAVNDALQAKVTDGALRLSASAFVVSART